MGKTKSRNCEKGYKTELKSSRASGLYFERLTNRGSYEVRYANIGLYFEISCKHTGGKKMLCILFLGHRTHITQDEGSLSAQVCLMSRTCFE
jgi:hypothetical protein